MDHLPRQALDQADNPGQLATALDMDEFLTLAEAAEQLRISDKTIRRRIKSGKLRATLMEGSHGQEYRVWKPDLHPPIEHQSPDTQVSRDAPLPRIPLTPVLNLDTFTELVTSAITSANERDRAQLDAALQDLRSSLERLEGLLLMPKPPWWQFWKR